MDSGYCSVSNFVLDRDYGRPQVNLLACRGRMIEPAHHVNRSARLDPALFAQLHVNVNRLPRGPYLMLFSRTSKLTESVTVALSFED